MWALHAITIHENTTPRLPPLHHSLSPLLACLPPCTLPPSSPSARSRSSRSSPAPASVRRPTEASAARRDPWARSDADWTPIEGPPDESQHAPTAPRNARLARVAASRAACGASRPSAVATRSHQRAARNLDMPPTSNAQSARQGRNRDDRSRRPHTTGVSSRMLLSCACVHVCVRLRGPAVASLGGVGRARGTPTYLVGFARC